ncbi:hypothetical protein [Saccharopolyspora hattusasensis]|uniref:hypothetical protein n=1 Tax=Saccharopolyspora hattusasensis TaxID=1128679 RepID=UPI003D98D1D8
MPNDMVAAVCALIAGDPRNHDHVEAVVSAVLRDAAGDSQWQTTANGWRPLLPSWIRPPTIGATVQRLVAIGMLRPTGRYSRCTDTRSGNRGKPQPVYAVDLGLLDSLCATDAA